MPSGAFSLGETARGQSPKLLHRAAKVNGEYPSSSNYGGNAADRETGGVAPSTAEVTLRERKVGRSASSAVDRRAKEGVEVRRSGSSLTCPTNKRNATYLNEEEYDEDLAQLDMLLHYVNNLSASLEFLQWENKRISTDLVPTLLTMYDALYARLSEDLSGSTTTSLNSKTCPPPSKPHPSISEDQNANTEPSILTSAKESEDKSFHYNNELFIREDEDSVDESVAHTASEDRIIPVPLVCRECEKRRNSKDTQCDCVKRQALNGLSENAANLNNNSSDSGLYDILDTRLPVENDYDIPEDIENASDEEPSEVGDLCRSSPVTSTRPARLSKLTLSQDACHERPSPKGGSPLVGSRLLAARRLDPRRFQHSSSRPLSSISSSSSSSSSSNSLPRCPAPGLAYLASAESLENEEDRAEPEATRRKDRSLKSRREKSLRAGSDDSGVQCHSISLPAPPTLRPRYYDPNLNYMDRVVLEIIETEEGYVRDLKEVIEGYLKHWRANPQHGISLDIVESLFSNIEQIYKFNRCFLSQLEICGSDPVAVARCFVRNNSGFTIYTDYCTNYPKTVDVLTKMMQREESVQACRERQLSLSHTLPLGSYLLKPVQRVLKYHLLLGNILKNFDKERPGHTDIVNALSTMTGMAHHINDMKRRHEHSVRVQEIQSLLIDWHGNDLTTYGELAAEGTFRIHGFKGLRHVFLFDKMLLLTKKKDENILIYKTHIMCSNLMLIESIPREPLSFHVIPFDCPRLQYTLECRNLDQKREWTLQLKRVIIENFSATIPAHARQLVMELGQTKPDEGSVTETRGGGGGGGRKTHHAPEYLERRKDRRRTSEVGLNSRLRIRRSSRARKEKGEKTPRSRSASRNRDTEEELDRKISNDSVVEVEKPKIKLPMWRRRSEPGIRAARDSAPSTPELSPHPSPNPNLLQPCRDAEESSKRPSSATFEAEDKKMNRLSIPPDRIDFSSTPDCEKETGDEDAAENENVEHVISQLLQHHFQVQQSILNKQRRHLIRNKKAGTQYETSDTEVEEGFNPLPPLPTSPPPPLLNEGLNANNDNDLNDFSLMYDSLLCKDGEDVNSTSGWNSDAVSVCSSVTSVNNQTDYESLYYSNSHSTSNLSSAKQEDQRKISNYDNLLNIWGSIRCKSPEKRAAPSSSKDSGPFSLERDNIKRILRRVQSFSEETGTEKDSHDSSRSEYCPIAPSHHTLKVFTAKEETKERERPATIAVYDSSADAFDALERYLSHSCTSKTDKGEKFPLSLAEATENALNQYSFPAMSVDDLVNVHPEHKIYSKASVNKGSIRKILSKISLPKSPLSKYNSEPPAFPSTLQGDIERNSHRKASKLVSTMARHCSRTIKEKIKQITAEELEKEAKKEETTDLEKPQNINVYKPSSASIGARLANTIEQSDYAVPNLRSEPRNRSEIRPDSVLSSSSNWTSSSSSTSSSTSYSNAVFKKMEKENLLDITDVIEEIERSPESSSPLSDTSGDNFYEKSFEAIETLLENELFRDSAIYSDHEDNNDFSPKGPSRSGTLSPKSSFRIANYIKSEDIIIKDSFLIDPLSKTNAKIVPDHPQITPEDSFVNSLTPNEEPQNEEEQSYSSLPYPTSDTAQSERRVPPPVPAKPEGAKGKRIRGSLIQKQLKNLEECSKFPRDGASSITFEGFKSLEERRKLLASSSEKMPEAGHRFSLSPTPSCTSPLPSLGVGSPATDSTGMSKEGDFPAYSSVAEPGGRGCASVDGDIVMARGWVKHVVGKLQFNA